MLHQDYQFVTQSDFEVDYIINSDEAKQDFEYQIVDVVPRYILVKLTFTQPLLVSQGKQSDQIVVKLNKDLFLIPKRFEDISTIKDPDEKPYHNLESDLPKMVASK